MDKEGFSLLEVNNDIPAYRVLPPVFFSDLQLDKIIKAIIAKYTEFDIRKYFYTLPSNIETVVYRQEIYKDISSNPNLFLGLKLYTNRLLEARKAYRYYLQSDDDIKKGSYLLMSCHDYILATQNLLDVFNNESITSRGLKTFMSRLADLYEDDAFLLFKKKVDESYIYMDQLRLRITIKDKELSVSELGDEGEEDGDGNIFHKITEFMDAFDIEAYKDITGISAREAAMDVFPAPLETSPLEDTLINIIKNDNPKVFSVFKEFKDNEFNLEEDVFFKVKDELIYYIAFYEFEQQFNKTGRKLEFAHICHESTFDIEGVYDIALAWNNRFNDYRIIENDVSYNPGKSFIVITGPNQGGKTTLARALGQSLYLSMMGFKAPCRSFKISYFEQIITHFEIEESIETGAGKLKEELNRLKDAMVSHENSAFVILNELFTTATTYDAVIMGKKVMQHFKDDGCIGVYVTHIKELASEEELDYVQSMVAQLDSFDKDLRTYKIICEKAVGLGYSDTLVKEFKLDFDSVKRRLDKSIGGSR